MAQQQHDDRIDIEDPESRSRWTQELDATEEQLREAVKAVGTLASDVELHLKGVRSADGDELVHPVAFYTLNSIPVNDNTQ